MIRKSGNRFSEKIMRKQRPKTTERIFGPAIGEIRSPSLSGGHDEI
jgi:hypothetical protein